MNSIEVTEDNFDQVIMDNDLVVIDFWAEWCAPCKAFQKVVEALALRYSDIVFASVDIEAQQGLAEDFHIMSVPAVLIVRQQVIVCAETGLMTLDNLADLIDQAKALTPEQLERVATDQE